MSKKQFSIMLVVAMVAGFAGGFVFNHAFKTKDVFADSIVKDKLYVKELIIVGEKNEPLAILSSKLDKKSGPSLLLFDAEGHLGIQLEASGVGPLLRFYDKEGRSPCLFGFVNGGPVLTLEAPQGSPYATDKIKAGIKMLLFYDSTSKRYIPTIAIYNDEGKMIWDAPLGLSK